MHTIKPAISHMVPSVLLRKVVYLISLFFWPLSLSYSTRLFQQSTQDWFLIDCRPFICSTTKEPPKFQHSSPFFERKTTKFLQLYRPTAARSINSVRRFFSHWYSTQEWKKDTKREKKSYLLGREAVNILTHCNAEREELNDLPAYPWSPRTYLAPR